MSTFSLLPGLHFAFMNKRKFHTGISDEFTEYINKEMTGEQFTKLFPDTKFVKLTSETENHNGFQFADGPNVDFVPFNSTQNCSAGGIYFTTAQKMHLWFSYGCSGMKYTRYVTIPNDARVYIEEDKFKADKIFLGPRNLIDYDTIKKAVAYRGTNLQYVKDQTEELCKIAVQEDGLALHHVNTELQTASSLSEICKFAVQEDGNALQYVKEQTDDICKLAVLQNGIAIGFVKQEFRTEEICKIAALLLECEYSYILECFGQTKY